MVLKLFWNENIVPLFTFHCCRNPHSVWPCAISTDKWSLASKSPYTRKCRDGFRPLLIACPMEGDRPTRLHFEKRVNKARHCSEILRFLFGAIKIASIWEHDGLSTERAPKLIAMCFDCGCKVLVTVWFQTAEHKSAFKLVVTIFCVNALDLRKPCDIPGGKQHFTGTLRLHIQSSQDRPSATLLL